MKAILTKYLSPTNTKGARIKAFDCDGNSVTISYPHELSGEEVHREAARAFIAKYKWPVSTFIGGTIKGGYAFVIVE